MNEKIEMRHLWKVYYTFMHGNGNDYVATIDDSITALGPAVKFKLNEETSGVRNFRINEAEYLGLIPVVLHS